MAHLGKHISILLLSFGATGVAAQAEDDADRAPVVVEFFTSQACSSCVTAGALFNDIATQKDVIALGWHVDYWNMLATKRGQWADPYSSAAWSKRQRKYNINIRQRSSVYTPQIVIDGASEVIGSSKEKVAAKIEAARETPPAIKIDGRREGDEITFDIGASDAGGNAYLVRFKRMATTKIRGGENAGVEVSEANVVTDLEKLGLVLARGNRISVPRPEAGDGCAILVQEPGQGRILAAAYCPSE